MNRTPRALLKGASSILSEGASLTSNGALFDSREAKDAFKGFVKDPDTKKMAGQQNAPDKPSASATQEKVTVKESAETSQVGNQAVKPRLVILKNRRRQIRQSERSIFEVYLVVLNTFLFLGILCTVSGVAFAIYASQYPTSQVSVAVLLQSAADALFNSAEICVTYIVDFFKDFDFIVYATYFSLAMNNLLSECSDFASHLPALFTDLLIKLSEYAGSLCAVFLKTISNFSEYVAVLFDETFSNLKSFFPN